MSFIDSHTIAQHGGTPVSTDVLDQSNHRVHQKECLSCFRIKPFGEFKRDSSYKEGVRDQCIVCESAPRMSIYEHTKRLQEASYNSYAVQKQRWRDQEDFYNDEARTGRFRYHTDLLDFIRDNIPDIYIMDGRIVGDLSIFRTFGRPQPHLDGRTFQYLFYIPLGWSPEHSLMEFDLNDIPIKEKQRGWRTVLLRLIKTGLTTEEKVNEYFGPSLGEGSKNWYRQLFICRNGHHPED